MPTLTFITVLIFVSIALLSSFITLHVDKLKRVIKRYTTFKRKPKHSNQDQIVALSLEITKLKTEVNELRSIINNDKSNLSAKVNRIVDKKLKQIIND